MSEKVLFIDEPAPRMEQELRKLGFICNHFQDLVENRCQSANQISDKSNIPPQISRLDHSLPDILSSAGKKEDDYSTLLPIAAQYSGFVIRSRFQIDREMIDAASNLRFIARIGAGMENIDTAYAEAKGIRCLNSPEGNADAVAEYVIGSIMNMLRQFGKMDSEVRQGVWQREANRGYELHRKTVGILGYGTMGRTLARKLSGFGCRVICHDKYLKNYGDTWAEAVDLDTFRCETDILSIHINYLPENHHYINCAFLNGFAKDILLVNTSRGKCLNVADLVQCLQTGKVQLATLDVLEYENIRLKIPSQKDWEQPLRDLAASERVFLSPHVAGQTFESLEKHVDVLVAKIKALGV